LKNLTLLERGDFASMRSLAWKIARGTCLRELDGLIANLEQSTRAMKDIRNIIAISKDGADRRAEYFNNRSKQLMRDG
jgi:hypothetical protein